MAWQEAHLRITGTVTRTYQNGFQLDNKDKWYNLSKFETLEMPNEGDKVSIELDNKFGQYVTAIDISYGEEVANGRAPASTPSTGRNQALEQFTRRPTIPAPLPEDPYSARQDEIKRAHQENMRAAALQAACQVSADDQAALELANKVFLPFILGGGVTQADIDAVFGPTDQASIPF